nr:RNA-directed DNA polymerase, eukaryota [Tanacetum cinerariifolium]
MEGLYNIKVKYMGDLEVMLILKTVDAAKNVVENTNHEGVIIGRVLIHTWAPDLLNEDIIIRFGGRRCKVLTIEEIRVIVNIKIDESVGKLMDEDEVLVEDTLKVGDDLVKQVELAESDPFDEEYDDEDDEMVEQTVDIGGVHGGNGDNDREENEELGGSSERFGGWGWCLLGDFIDVREPGDWFNSKFNSRDAKNFNEFIERNSLVEIKLGGQRKNSDHCPIVLKDMDLDFEPKPFRAFDLWLEDEELPKFANDRVQKLSADHALNLEALFSEKEVWKAMCGYGSDKAPGPDGFNFKHIKRFWDIIKEDLLVVVRWFWENADLSNVAEGLNALIGKAVNKNIFKGIHVGEDGIMVSHLQPRVELFGVELSDGIDGGWGSGTRSRCGRDGVWADIIRTGKLLDGGSRDCIT